MFVNTFSSLFSTLVDEFKGLSSLFKGDVFVQGALTKMCSNLSEIKNFFAVSMSRLFCFMPTLLQNKLPGLLSVLEKSCFVSEKFLRLRI